jgi:hypothetical protein
MIELMGSAGASDGRLFKNDLMFVGIGMLKESFGTEPIGNGYPVIINLNGIVGDSKGSLCKYDLMLGGYSAGNLLEMDLIGGAAVQEGKLLTKDFNSMGVEVLQPSFEIEAVGKGTLFMADLIGTAAYARGNPPKKHLNSSDSRSGWFVGMELTGREIFSVGRLPKKDPTFVGT